MKANELMVGNLVYLESIKDGSRCEHILTLNDLVKLSLGKIVLKPIPLTEDWLLKFEFEVDSNKSWIADNILYKLKENKLYLFGEDSQIYSQCFIIDCEYVHTLQNFLALTNKELRYE